MKKHINFRQKLSEQLNVRVDKNTLDMLNGIAGKEGVDKTEVVRAFIQEGIKKWDVQYKRATKDV